MQIWPLVQKNFIYIKRKPKATMTIFIFPMLIVFLIIGTSHMTYTKNKHRYQSTLITNLTFPDAHHKFHYFHDIAIVSTNNIMYNNIEYLLSHYSQRTNFTYYREPFENRNVTNNMI